MLTFLKRLAAAVPTPATNKVTVFVEDATGEPSYKDDTGTVTSLKGDPGEGVPTGGTAGQVLAKIDGTDYNTEWVDPAAGGGSTQGKQCIAVVAGAIRPSVSGGCAALTTIASAANQPDISTLDFDPGTIEYAQFSIPMPKKWNAGTVTVRFRWSHAATTTNFGVVWAAQALALSDDDAIAQNFGTAQKVTDTGGTTNDLYFTSETSAITIAGSPAKQDTVVFRVYRVATDGSDNLAIDARLHAVEVFVTTDADTDA